MDQPKRKYVCRVCGDKAKVSSVSVAYAFKLLLQEMQSTTTFKQRKVDFVKEGFNPNVVKDILYWYNSGVQKYEKFQRMKSNNPDLSNVHTYIADCIVQKYVPM